jgi:hypothetical protein
MILTVKGRRYSLRLFKEQYLRIYKHGKEFLLCIHMIDMKRTIILSLLLFGSLCGHAQDSFQKYVLEQRKAFAQYTRQEQENFKKYRDSLNRAFASFLEKEWQAYPLAKPKPPIDRPLPKPPVYDPVAPQPEPQNMPAITPPAPVPPADDTPPDTLAPRPRPEKDRYPVKTGFFGTPLSLKAIALPPAHLAGVSEKDAADCWRTLSAMSMMFDDN